ncbi:tail fiber domain-containing protein [Spirosoma litoris]
MKNRILFFLTLLSLCLSLSTTTYAQFGINAPTGVPPTQDLEVYTRNGFLVQGKYQRVAGDPNTSVTTMVNGANPTALTTVVGILKDPSSDGGYTAGVSYSAIQTISPSVSSSTVIGIEIIFDDLSTEATSDYVSLTDRYGYEQRFSGSNPPARIGIDGSRVTVQFITNNNSVVGRGFQFHWRALVTDNVPSTSQIAIGSSLQFDAYLSSFQAGSRNHASGSYSTALGSENIASANYSNALGSANTASGLIASALGFANNASGQAASALGSVNTASGQAASALGYNNKASGDYSCALGYNNTASGLASIVLGSVNTASGDYSSAFGYNMNTNGKKGAFMIGDSDPLGQGTTLSGVTDQFVGRFLNGYFLLTSGDKNTGSGSRTGVQIGQGQNSWASISDSTKKERFRPINHSDLLRKINAMRLTTWNYKGQHSIRHYGPMAQDFFAAFGQDGLGQVGCDTLIYSHDFAGVTFAGVQALIRENEALKARLASQEARLQQANARLDALEAVLIPRRRVARR